MDEFLDKSESAVLKQQRCGALEWALCATPTRWWIHIRILLETGAKVEDECAHDLEVPSVECEPGN